MLAICVFCLANSVAMGFGARLDIAHPATHVLFYKNKL